MVRFSFFIVILALLILCFFVGLLLLIDNKQRSKLGLRMMLYSALTGIVGLIIGVNSLMTSCGGGRGF